MNKETHLSGTTAPSAPAVRRAGSCCCRRHSAAAGLVWAASRRLWVFSIGFGLDRPLNQLSAVTAGLWRCGLCQLFCRSHAAATGARVFRVVGAARHRLCHRHRRVLHREGPVRRIGAVYRRGPGRRSAVGAVGRTPRAGRLRVGSRLGSRRHQRRQTPSHGRSEALIAVAALAAAFTAWLALYMASPSFIDTSASALVFP